MYIVYKHTNLHNGEVYIGITKQKTSRRWHGGHGYSKQPLFYNAILKYGWDAFSHEILLTGLSQEEAFQAEKDFIQKYNSTDREYGYNIASGGLDETVFTPTYRENLSKARRKRPPMSMETRKKIAESHRGKKMPPKSSEACRNLSIALTGRKFSAEHCKHISESKKGTQGGANNPRARKVICVETGIIYLCLKDAAKATNTDSHNISTVCNGRQKTSGGFHWKYAEEV